MLQGHANLYSQAILSVSPKVVFTVADRVFEVVKFKPSASATATERVPIHRVIIIPCNVARAIRTAASAPRVVPA